MTFLSKFGSLVSKFISVLTGFGPLISAQVPGSGGVISTVSKDLAQVADIIAQVEAIGQVAGLKGPDKLKAAAPLVAQVILKSSIMAGHEIHDKVLFQSASTKIADGMADLLNSLKDDVKEG